MARTRKAEQQRRDRDRRAARKTTKPKARASHRKPAEVRTQPKRKPRQQQLPGTEDHTIVALEDAANEYVEKRDHRMEIGKEEATLKQELLALMKKHGKERYHRDGITITVIREAEKVEVRVKKADEINGDDVEVETEQDDVAEAV